MNKILNIPNRSLKRSSNLILTSNISKQSISSINLVSKFLKTDNIIPNSPEDVKGRIVRDIHYSFTLPQQFPNMKSILWNLSTQKLIEKTNETIKDKIICNENQSSILYKEIENLLKNKSYNYNFFSQFYCFIYGKTSNKTWQGLFGDGRVTTLGEFRSLSSSFPFYDVQLKGAGPTPYCQGYDGKGSLRGGIREFLGSEISHNLGILTARCLQLIDTNETIIRRWYHTKDTFLSLSDKVLKEKSYSTSNSFIFPNSELPSGWVEEPGSISSRLLGCPIRLSQFEMYKRSSDEKSKELLDNLLIYSLYRTNLLTYREDDAHLIKNIKDVNPSVLLKFFYQVNHNLIDLIINWERVGYSNGSLSSDNLLISGENFDFGPYNFMENFSRKKDNDVNYIDNLNNEENNLITNQSGLLLIYLSNFKEIIKYSIRNFYLNNDNQDSIKEKSLQIMEEINNFNTEDIFKKKYIKMISMKLGLSSYNDNELISLWKDLEILLEECQFDFTIFFDSLRQINGEKELENEIIFKILEESTTIYSSPEVIQSNTKKWFKWMKIYYDMILKDNNKYYRETTMRKNNPTFILRNWMSIMAYESYLKGDLSILEEIVHICQIPYNEGTEEQREKWRRSTPIWAKNSPGITYLSCSS